MRVLIAVVLTMLMTACGFQLRDQVKLPEGVAAIRVQGSNMLSPLVIELERELLANGVGAEKQSSAAATLELINEGVAREILSVNDRARVSEFVLIARARARLMDANDASKELIAPFEVSVRREYSFDEAQALGAAQEEEIISAELQRELAQSILLKLQK